MSRIPLLLILALAVGCTSRGAEPASDGRLIVVTTTTMLADLVTQVGGDAVDARSLLSPGADPHLYRPRPSDAAAIASADVVVTSGIGLEGWVDDLIDGAGGDAVRIVASDSITPLHHPEYPDTGDPHFWFDLALWEQAAATVSEGLLAAAPEADRDSIQVRSEAYRARLRTLDEWASQRLRSIPEGQRTLITSHDAFHYFGARYGLEVRGLQGLTTEQQPSQRDVANTIEFVRDAGVPAVFVETSVNPTAVERVAREADVAVAGPLYSDSIGGVGTPAETFEGTFVENVRMIVEALGGTWLEPGA